MIKLMPDKESATLGLIILYGLYVVSFALICAYLLMRIFPSGIAAVVRTFLLDGWMDIWWLGYLVFPIYIRIFNRVYERLIPVDVIALCMPVVLWLVVTFGIKGGEKPGGNAFVESEMVLIMTGAYFFIFPISRWLPGISKTTIRVGLLLPILTGVQFVVNSTYV